MEDEKTRHVHVWAPTNIAVIKYWGKRDVKLNLPANESISMTLHLQSLRTETRIQVNEEDRDLVILNQEYGQCCVWTQV